jgi:SAM-dependent methyltransferase
MPDHARYRQQARWTESLRSYLFDKTGWASARRVLDLGCGTGALLEALTAHQAPTCHGVDLSLEALEQAGRLAPRARLLCADGAALPYPAATFDLAFCHFVLLWVADPRAVLAEMRRVTRPGGAVLALAEPDYGGRIDAPESLAALGRWQASALRERGADPQIGRKLAGLFARAGLHSVETGVLGGEWSHSTPGEWEQEWAVLEADLAGKVPLGDLHKLKALEAEARQRGERVLFVPTFFAWGRV